MSHMTAGEESLEKMWSLFAEGIPDILLQLSADGNILHINRTPGGLTASDVLGRNVFLFLLPSSRSTVRQALDEVFAGGDSQVDDLLARQAQQVGDRQVIQR